jgi:pimeloyl-ACP methyl ester carboxylesterase
VTPNSDRKRRILYLHGFASGPASSKAQFFRQRFAERDIQLEILDLADGDFEHLTISGQLRVIERAACGEPVTLLGSSLGGYLAALYASSHPEVERLVLLAPAFCFPSRWPERVGPVAMADWVRTRKLEVFHYAENRPVRLDYGFYEDGRNYPEEPDFAQPALLIHGTRDDVVPADLSRRFAHRHPNVELHLLDSGHELTDALEPIWRLTRDFLRLQ